MLSEFIGAKSTIGTAQGAFESGMAASWAVLSAAVAFPLFGLFLAKKLYNTGEFTISGAIFKRYGKSTQLAPTGRPSLFVSKHSPLVRPEDRTTDLWSLGCVSLSFLRTATSIFPAASYLPPVRMILTAYALCVTRLMTSTTLPNVP